MDTIGISDEIILPIFWCTCNLLKYMALLLNNQLGFYLGYNTDSKLGVI